MSADGTLITVEDITELTVRDDVSALTVHEDVIEMVVADGDTIYLTISDAPIVFETTEETILITVHEDAIEMVVADGPPGPRGLQGPTGPRGVATASAPLSLTGDALSLDTTGPGAGTYAVSEITIDAYGRITGVAEMAALAHQANHVDTTTATGVLYAGYSDKDGAWWIKKFDETTTPAALQHATHANNAGYSTYAAAWGNRTTLTYGRYDEAF